MAQKHLHAKICENLDKLTEWYCRKTTPLAFPIYSSYDIRDAGYKITNVDANIYPAGFNNICPADQETCGDLFADYLTKRYTGDLKRIMLVTEEHTQNPFYWQNVSTIKKLIEQGGFEVMLAFPRAMEKPLELQNATGEILTVHSAFENSDSVRKFSPQLIISNNDFSDPKVEWAAQITLPVNPPRELGWYQRKKSNYFVHYNKLVGEFAQIAGFDPFLLNIRTELVADFNMSDDASVNSTADCIDQMIEGLRSDYNQRGIKQDPFVFVKNNSGTYGLAVVKVNSGVEYKALNYKTRKKMKAAKGGRDVEEVIIQEGIPSIVKAEGSTAEPVIYMIGCQLAGGFLRTHSEKSDSESLNSPGAVYKRLCISDLAIKREACPLENVYGWTAKLGLLAIAQEGEQMGVKYSAYKTVSCGD